MVSVAQKAKVVYEQDMREHLEAGHRNEYVAIEPVSRGFFVRDTFVAAALAAREAYRDRRSFVIRVGHEVAFHLGAIAF